MSANPSILSSSGENALLDVCVIGGGIVGLATAHAVQQAQPGLAVAVLEQEADIAAHQTGHNSGVIHSGIYYAPGSLKARLCREGAASIKAFCAEAGIPVATCGKLLVATDAQELGRMEDLRRRAAENGIACEPVDRAALARREPAIAGLGALFVPATAIVDYAAICRALAARITAANGVLHTVARVMRIEETSSHIILHTQTARYATRMLVACAGLQADRIASLNGITLDFRIVPFRGEYYRLPDSRKNLVRSLIYPIPDPALPFLGVHLTRALSGAITVGPNAVLSLARERYGKFAVSLEDCGDMLRFPGFWRMLRGNFSAGMNELRQSLSKRAYLQACRKYCPSLAMEDLLPMQAGIRAQAVLHDGTLVQDFLFRRTARAIHLCNAPSPAATSALPTGRMIAEEVMKTDVLRR